MNVVLDETHLVCFIVSPTGVDAPVRIFPFDSGAFCQGLYSRVVSDKYSLEAFEIYPQEVPTCSRAVSAFFGNNKAYYDRKPNLQSTPGSLDLEVKSLHELLCSKGLEGADDRRGVIEIQATANLPLRSSTIEAVVLPDEFADDTEIRNFVEGDLRAELLPYWCPRSEPADDTVVIMNETRKYLERRGYFE